MTRPPTASLPLARGLALALAAAACSGDPAMVSEPDPDIPQREFCPDPESPYVHYLSDDANECRGVILECTVDQNGFQNACGCGCLDKGHATCPAPSDPEIIWLGRDPETCAELPPG